MSIPKELDVARLDLDGSEFDPILEAIEPLALIFSEIFDDVSYEQFIDFE